jgi:hypothetical protein
MKDVEESYLIGIVRDSDKKKLNKKGSKKIKPCLIDLAKL